MGPPPPFLLSLLLLLLHLLSTTTICNTTTTLPPTSSPTSSPKPTPPTTTTHSTLDPKQLRALQSLNLPTSKDPCFQPTTTCDNSSPFRHLLSLHLSNCTDDISLSFTALKSLSTLQNLSFTNCPIAPVHFPSDLSLSLHSFSCIHSLRHLTGVWLSHFVNLTDLTVSNVQVNASGLFVIVANMHKLKSVTISHANLTGSLPKHLHSNLTHIDLSGNELKGKIPTSLTLLENLVSLNLSSNALNGEIPIDFGDLISLKNVSLGYNFNCHMLWLSCTPFLSFATSLFNLWLLPSL